MCLLANSWAGFIVSALCKSLRWCARCRRHFIIVRVLAAMTSSRSTVTPTSHHRPAATAAAAATGQQSQDLCEVCLVEERDSRQCLDTNASVCHALPRSSRRGAGALSVVPPVNMAMRLFQAITVDFLLNYRLFTNCVIRQNDLLMQAFYWLYAYLFNVT